MYRGHHYPAVNSVRDDPGALSNYLQHYRFESDRLIFFFREDLPDLELAPMSLGCALYESGGVQSYVYFPTTSIVSLLYVMQNGLSAEIAITGNEGLVGVSLLMGGETTPSRAVVQSAGMATG